MDDTPGIAPGPETEDNLIMIDTFYEWKIQVKWEPWWQESR